MNAKEIMATDQEYYLPVFARYPLVLSHGRGAYVYDVEGRKYLDFLAGIAVNIIGHAHPKLVAAIAEQAGKIIHCSNLYYTAQQATLAESLVKLSGLGKVFLGNSGAEANEGAVKLARKYGKAAAAGKFEIVAAEHSFHGRTLATLTATGQPKYQKGYEPLPPGFIHVPFNDLEALKAAVSEKTCAVMLEPIQGEGGVNLPDAGYLAAVRELCDTYGALLIFDEIQTGVGRTGKMFAYEHFGFKPDIVTLAKGLGGGVPIGAFIASDRIAAAFGPGDHGSTFGGNPLACAAALTTLDCIDRDGLRDNAIKVGELIRTGLAEALAGVPGVVEIRGRGLMIGVELDRPCGELVTRGLEAGLLINVTAEKVVRLLPALVFTEDEARELVARLAPLIRTFLGA